jgi:hypothetical protein
VSFNSSIRVGGPSSQAKLLMAAGNLVNEWSRLESGSPFYLEDVSKRGVERKTTAKRHR